MLRTRVTEAFGIEYPVMSAPMGLYSGGRLAAAVSQAGGLGMFGGTNPAGGGWVREQIDLVRAQTDRPFGVGYITPFIRFFEDTFTAALEEKAPVIGLSFAEPEPWLSRAKEAGATVICQVQTMDQAREAAAAGADMLVAQGSEAGGHAGEMNLLPLLAAMLDAFPDLPVLAAGGIASGRALATVLGAGADGAWVGTAFMATPEAVEVPDAHKDLLVSSTGEDTVFTRVFDIVEGYPWPEWVGARLLNNRFAREWVGREDEVRARRDELKAVYEKAQEERDTDVLCLYMGQGVGDVRAVRPAADVLRDMCDEAERILRARSGQILT